MKRCPEYLFTRAWKLGDGRYKCHRCGKRYCLAKPKVIWDCFRLSNEIKCRLLDYFLLGVPSYRLRFHNIASHLTRERFFRLIRAVMAYEENMREPL